MASLDDARDCARRLAARVLDGGALFVDGFCVAKFPSLAPALAADGFVRVESHPVFVRPGLPPPPA